MCKLEHAGCQMFTLEDIGLVSLRRAVGNDQEHDHQDPYVVSHLLNITSVVLLFGTHQCCHFEVLKTCETWH